MQNKGRRALSSAASMPCRIIRYMYILTRQVLLQPLLPLLLQLQQLVYGSTLPTKHLSVGKALLRLPFLLDIAK